MNKFVKEFKLTKKSKTIKKPAIDTSLANEKPINPVINNNPEGNYLSKKLDSHQTNIKPRQQYLFFKTPSNEEKKKFDFPKENDNKENKIVENISK